MSVSFKVSAEDARLIGRVVDAAIKSYHEAGIQVDRQSLLMDLFAVHANGCPLDLDAMLDAEGTFDFAHDIAGIQRHLNRTTGRLEDCFEPRFARQAVYCGICGAAHPNGPKAHVRS